MELDVSAPKKIRGTYFHLSADFGSAVIPALMDGEFAKCNCEACGNRIEFPSEGAGSTINCPHCGQPTILDATPLEQISDPSASAISAAEIVGAFDGTVPRTPVSFFYQVGLFFVAIVMVLLPLIYIAMILAAGWGVYAYATHFSFFLKPGHIGGRGYILQLMLYFGPLFVGAVLLFFMVKPLFARSAPRAEPLALNPAVERTLFAFIAKICNVVGAPMPNRIDLDCQLNASAGFRRGAWSMFGNDLVLTIGLPLVAGLNTRQLAGVIAHEFGHFTQGFGMRLSYVIRSVNGWFARVVYERDVWDLALVEMSESQEWQIQVIVGCARLAVWFSRLLLMSLMFAGHAVSCFLLRQMEYDADSYEIKLAGSEDFETTAVRLNLLNEALARTYKTIRTTWNLNHELPDNFPAYLLRHEAELPPVVRKKIQDTLGLAKTSLLSTHPCDADRIRAARKGNEPGIFHLDLPATTLFSNFEIVSRQVSQVHYVEDLGIELGLARFMPAEKIGGAKALPDEPAESAITAAKIPTTLKLKTVSPPKVD